MCSLDFPEAFFEFVSCVTIGSLPLGEVQGVLREFPNACLENRTEVLFVAHWVLLHVIASCLFLEKISEAEKRSWNFEFSKAEISDAMFELRVWAGIFLFALDVLFVGMLHRGDVFAECCCGELALMAQICIYYICIGANCSCGQSSLVLLPDDLYGLPMDCDIGAS